MCKGIRDLMADAKNEGIEENKLEIAQNLLGLLEDEIIADTTGLPLDAVRTMHNEVLQNQGEDLGGDSDVSEG